MNSLRKKEYVKRKSWHDRFLQLSSYLKLCALVCFTRNFSRISDCIQRKLSRPRMSQYSESGLQNPKTPKRKTKSMSNRKGSDINFFLENLWMSSATLLTHYWIQITPWRQLFTSEEIMTVTVFEYLIFISIFFLRFYFSVFSLVLVSIEKIYRALKTVFDHIFKHLEVGQNCSARRHIFNSLLGISWKCG